MYPKEPLEQAMLLPNGARFHRCAFQVNPFEYVIRQQKETKYKDEDQYNDAIVSACQEQQIQVIAITDHYRVHSSEGLRRRATSAGLFVFPAFEARTRDGVHFLCLFPSDRTAEELERIIGECGIHDREAVSPAGNLYVVGFLEKVREWGGIAIAAHAASAGGLLKVLSGDPRIEAWQSPNLLACCLPGPASEAPENLRSILSNTDPQYRRARRVAVVNAADVAGPADLSAPTCSCWIKMSELSIEGLRQAFLDPESRIRLASDSIPPDHAEFVAIAWEAGFLDGSAIHFNENLNVLIGGRGTGKSTVVESIRCALDLQPAGEETQRLHTGIVGHVLRNGTKISLLVRSHRPAKQEYLIERTIPNPPVVRDQNGTVLKLAPSDVIPRVEVYGQHEISELARSPEKRTHLLDRFQQDDRELSQRKESVRRKLETNRRRIVELASDLERIDERLASLPVMEERLKRFRDAGLEERLGDKSILVQEERVFDTASRRIRMFEEVLKQVKTNLPVDRTFCDPPALAEFPRQQTLKEIWSILGTLEKEATSVADDLATAIKNATDELEHVRSRWQEQKETVEKEYEQVLRDLQKENVDGTEFINVVKGIEALSPIREQGTQVRRELKQYQDIRTELLVEWEEIKAEQFRSLERAANTVNKQLRGRVRVELQHEGNREPLEKFLREQVGGRLAEVIKILSNMPALSLRSLADASCRGADHLIREFSLPLGGAKMLAEMAPSVRLHLEELELGTTTQIELNVAPEGVSQTWRALDDLSTGQRATAVLLLLLLESDAPLVVDQPEDDLDNRFISEVVVPKMREEKRQRQFVFSTHNANIPVLGDAELIVGLSASGEPGYGKAVASQKHMGSIDIDSVRTLVETVLEGGKDAFETRRLKYGY